MENVPYINKWHRELELFYKLKSLIILEGNILDLYTYPENGIDMSLPQYLYYFLKSESRGYENVVMFDGQQGFSEVISRNGDDNLTTFLELGGASSADVVFSGQPGNGAEIAKRVMQQNKVSSAIIMDLASRYLVSPENMNQQLVDSFSNLLRAAQNAAICSNGNRNLLIMIVNKLNDIPAWFYLDNPFVKTLHISVPGSRERESLLEDEYFGDFFDADIFEADMAEYASRPEDLKKIKDRFVGITEGFTMRELRNLMRLCADEKYHIHEITDVVDLYRYGIKENPWTDRGLQETLRNGREIVGRRVKGQEDAVNRTLDVIKRAAAGMSGLQHSSHTKPKGILFFAGPTGTGKTEMAKTLAQMLFGDESRCIRFDMSEYSAEHADQKLLGAPPGYVGYEAGGQLTNAVRENPFSILLFDEIEKAHGSILDKFLQILEDGRMTDGQGNTVYFSETVIIFTSNLGIYTRDQSGRRSLNVSADDAFEDVEKKVRAGVENYFKLELGRPEILNRIGENIVVFDFIRQDAARAILDSQLTNIQKRMKDENRVELTLSEELVALLLEKAFGNLENGGRGVGNVVEKYLLNPLASFMLDNECITDASISVGLDETGQVMICRA